MNVLPSWVLSRAWHVLRHEGLSALVRRLTGLSARIVREGISAIPTRTSSLDQQYHQWLCKKEQPSWNEEQHLPLDTEADMKVSILLLLTEWQPQHLTDSLLSILQQASPHWELVVVCHPNRIRDVSATLDRSETRMPRKELLRVLACDGIFEELLSYGISSASGDFIWLLRSGDHLHIDAVRTVRLAYHTYPTTDIFYCDNDHIHANGTRTAPFFKPSWSPELLLSTNYISYAMIFRRELATKLLGRNPHGLCATNHDWTLNLTEQTDEITRIPKVLYHVMETPPLPHETPFPMYQQPSAERDAIERALSRRGIQGRVECLSSGRKRLRYPLSQLPLVSILIPTKDRLQLLSRCLNSLSKHTTYAHIEILVLDNGSESEDCVTFLKNIAAQWTVISCPGPFNFSAMNNRGAESARGDYLLFLNDDTEVIDPEWLTIMLEQATQPQIGAVGAKLLFPNDTIQHGGIVLGIGGIAGHAFRHCPNTKQGYHNFPHLRRNCSAVSAACMMVPRQVFQSVGGFDEQLPVEFNDVDLCLRIRRDGYRIVYTPEAILYHYENATRKGSRAPDDSRLFQRRWATLLEQGDPYYHPNLTLRREDWSLNV